MSQKLPSIAELPSLPQAAQTRALDLLFEPSPAIHSILGPVIRTASYASYVELIEKCRLTFLSIAATSTSLNVDPALLSVISSHPRLGAKKVDSAQSAAEQATLRGEDQQLAELNQEYEAKFPGLRFVVFVNGRDRSAIMHDMRVRIDRDDFSLEVEAALLVTTAESCLRVHSITDLHYRQCVKSPRTGHPSLSDRRKGFEELKWIFMR